MITLTLKGSVPSKKNNKQIRYRNGSPMITSSDNFQEWHEEQIWSTAIRKCQKIKGPVQDVQMEFFVNSKRKADLTNKAESVMDLLVDAGILEDDNFFIVPAITLLFGGVDSKNPRVHV